MVSRRIVEAGIGGGMSPPWPITKTGAGSNYGFFNQPHATPNQRNKKGSTTTLIVAYRTLGFVTLLYCALSARLWLAKGQTQTQPSVFDINENGVFNKGTIIGVSPSAPDGWKSLGPPLEVDRVEHIPARSDTGLFVTMGSYIIDGDAAAGSTESKRTDDLILLVIGVGDFTKIPQRSSDALEKIPPAVPKGLKCLLRDIVNGKDSRIDATFHSNGTAYQGKISPTRGALWFGERAVWISCPVPKLDTSLQMKLVQSPEDYTIRIILDSPNGKLFDSNPTRPSLTLSTRYRKPIFKLTLCSSAIYGLTSTKWMIEYLEYHRAAGFDSMDLYVHRVGELVTRVLDFYIQQNSPQFHVRVHDWKKMVDGGKIGFDENTGVGRGVQGEAWEHGQRLTRNDCYLRNRGRSHWIMFSDVDELFTSNVLGKTVWEGPIMQYCEIEFKKNPEHIACSFSSVTTPPNARAKDPSMLILERIDVSEASCQSPYNCGRFHYGREKYAIRTAFGTLNPNSPFFYHAISQNYEIAQRHHVLVSPDLGVVRHYAGHFSHSRKGGLPSHKAKNNPLQYFVIQQMRSRIYAEGTDLNKLYEIPNQQESFLKLDSITDFWRFAKPGERPDNIVNKEEAVTSASQQNSIVTSEHFITFDYFGGRLNNQLWTLDWVFRVALALNRTAILGAPRAREHYIGFPSGYNDGSLWDIDALRNAPFRFKFAWEITDPSEQTLLLGEKSSLPEECVWEFTEANKYVMYWAWKTACQHKRIHFSTGNGLVHSYKADTRKYGVDPLVYWRNMRLHPDVFSITQSWWKQQSSKALSSAIGLHFRSWREANGDAAHALKVCKRLSEKLLSNAAKRFSALSSKCDPGCKGSEEVELDVYKFWRDNNFDITCQEATEERIRTICHETLSSEVDFFVATDHETVEADQILEGLGAKMMLHVDTKWLIEKFYEKDSNGLSVRKYASSILPILLDVSALLQVGRFFGSPASTLSQAVCLWRRAFDLKEEQPGMCQLVWYSTYSDKCEELCFENL